MADLYKDIRATVDETGRDDRVEVNQRALIDKILARYASAGAVYRELLQNSNDADATTAEIYFSTSKDGNIVEQVVYRNNGMPFRTQDWSRLRKIAEGNPDVSKVGAFGVGAYTMFSICEEPLVISGTEALAFVWKGDALWTKSAPSKAKATPWTSFVLPSRDPYPLPDLAEFGEFLCASLTFTKSLKELRVFVNNEERLLVVKNLVQEPRLVSTPKRSLSSWWTSSSDSVVTSSPRGIFFLGQRDQSIYESVYRVTVQLDGDVSMTDARIVSATANTKLPADMARRMERVTKKKPPKQVLVEFFLNADEIQSRPLNPAERVTRSFAPQPGAGRIFIGFRTSQTTGLAAHLAAPFVPTVEREAMDLQDPTLRIFNTELLEFAGIVMRLSLDHSFALLDSDWQRTASDRDALENKLEAEAATAAAHGVSRIPVEKQHDKACDDNSDPTSEMNKARGIMGFARFMAKNAKKSIASAVKTVEKMMGDGSELLNPPDHRPLCKEERQAILLMQSFCPQQSTPDYMVGTTIAQGFSRCMPNLTPPVLTRTGVVRGDVARLPHQGIEGFVRDNVIRRDVFDNARDYHNVIAECQTLQVDDLLLNLEGSILDEEKAVKLVTWWTKYSRVDPNATATKSLALKDAIRFNENLLTDTKDKTSAGRSIVLMRNLLFFVGADSFLSGRKLPLPETVIPSSLQDRLGLAVVTDVSLRGWFGPLPIEIWADYICNTTCMTDGNRSQEKERVEILSILHQNWMQRYPNERSVFGKFCKGLLYNKRSIPIDNDQHSEFAAEKPSELYLYSAELKAFEGIGSFHKVGHSLKLAGISEEFLLTLGVRKSLSIDILFTNLDKLAWRNDPKPLIEYLRTATLTKEDFSKLVTTKYLPAENNLNTYAPSELYLPSDDIRKLSFVKIFQWPSEVEIAEGSRNGQFLVKLGMKSRPPLSTILDYVVSEVKEGSERIKYLEYLCDRLGPNGAYYKEYCRIPPARKRQLRILPCTVGSVLYSDAATTEIHSPLSCFSDEACNVMGFPIIDPKLGSSRDRYGQAFQCTPEPETELLLTQLMMLVVQARDQASKVGIDGKTELATKTEDAFKSIFRYLSHRSSDFNSTQMIALRTEPFIPCQVKGSISWFKVDQVFFRREEGTPDALTEELFQVVDFSPFLATAGVKQEASTRDLFQIMLLSPRSVFDTLGSEKKYRSLLRRIAADPPFSRVTPQIRKSPFLLAYLLETSEGKNCSDSSEVAKCELAAAESIYIVDNSFFGRMFPVKRAPHESDLEDFYVGLGSKYISKSVSRRFEVVGKDSQDTPLTSALRERILERSPLLVSPSITSRPLVENAAAIVSSENLDFIQAPSLLAVYSLGGTVRRARTTCFSRQVGMKRGRNAIYVVKDFDWFDVGYAIGDLVLQRCQLEDAFFISSLLEAPLEQLRTRGFPVDRILKPVPVVEPSLPSPATSRPLPEQVDQWSTKASDPGVMSRGDAKSIQTPPSVETVKRQSGSPTIATIPPKSAVAEASASDTPPSAAQKSGFRDILSQMFPDADEEYIQQRLGANPSLEDVRLAAEAMSSGSYPRKEEEAAPLEDKSDDTTVSTTTSDRFPETDVPTTKSRNGLRKKFGRALGGFRGSNPSASGPSPSAKIPNGVSMPAGELLARPGQSGPSMAGPSTSRVKEPRQNVSPASDAASQKNLESMLQHTVGQSAAVDRNGLEAPESHLLSVPEELDRGETCEAIPAQSLSPFAGTNGSGQSSNGIRVFFARGNVESERFLWENLEAVECFAVVLERLCHVFGLEKFAIAIFHDPSGGTIAFNSNRALHFNVRFFYALHYLPGKAFSAECYSYWFVTTAHELAHHVVSAHNKEHGFYTESYVALYLPKLVALLSSIADE